MEQSAPEPIEFQTHPEVYKHLRLTIDGPVARILLDIQEDRGLRPGYALKLNSYDLSVDIELADAVNRLRFEHPDVRTVVISSAQDGIFSSGANIFMLGSSTHSFKVNFCKFTNETRLAIEDASQNSNQRYLAALNGIASGGGYELALACEEIYLVDDRRSAVALPEVPYLGVLPGTGGLTRVVDKRRVRRDHADVFCTLAEGLKGKRAKQWRLVDDVYPSSQFAAAIDARVGELTQGAQNNSLGVELSPLQREHTDEGLHYQHVSLLHGDKPRTAILEVRAPTDVTPISADHLRADWYPLQMFRELDDALLQLRFNQPEVGLVVIRTRGIRDNILAIDKQLQSFAEHWFGREVLLHAKRVLKRLDLTAKSFFALVDAESCFAGTLLELALAADRSYMLEDDAAAVQTSWANGGVFPMSNNLSRLQCRFLHDPRRADDAIAQETPFDADAATELGLVTASVDELDWDDDIRLAIEERVSLSPDSLTGMEANLRFAGPETMETKIFGRLSAWQNWIFQRDNAVGPQGALTLYGQPESPQFHWGRT